MLFFIIILAHEFCAAKVPLRIYGGFDAKSEEYPFVVRIEKQTSYIFTDNTGFREYRHLCTASALSPVWLISAAHCLEGKFPFALKYSRSIVEVKMVIRYGQIENLTSNDASISDVIYTVKHPQYVDWGVGGALQYSRNDIGLLKTTPIKIKSYMKVSAVDYKTVYGHEVIIGGFGRMAMKDADGNTVATYDTLFLMKPLQLLKVLSTKCRYDEVSAPAICLTPKCGDRTSACPGDSGGPVIHPSGLLGVMVSAKTTCLGKIRRVKLAGTAIPLSPYIEWIYSYVNA